ncbi:MAG: DUF1822 family protein [Cyanobacteria bacterium P01_F01_bin.150]
MTTPTRLDNWVAVEHTTDVIPLDPEPLDLSHISAQDRWAYSLQQLAIQGFERWLQEREPSLSCNSLNNTTPMTALVQVGEFNVCLIPVSLADNEVAIPLAAVEQADGMAHFYVAIAIDEEAEVASLEGFLPYNQLIAICADIPADADQTYPLPAAALNPDVNALLLFLRHLSVEAIALPMPTPSEPFLLIKPIRQPLTNAWRWLQRQADSLFPNDGWQLMPTTALRFDTDSIHDQLTEALRHQSLPTLPAEAGVAYQSITLAGCTFRLYVAIWSVPDGSGSWMLLAVLSPQAEQVLPSGVSLIIDEITPDRPRVELARETLVDNHQTTVLFAQVKGDRHDIFDVTVAVADDTMAGDTLAGDTPVDNEHRWSAAIQFQPEA